MANIGGTVTNNLTFNLSGDLTKDIAGANGTTILQSTTANIDADRIIAGTLDVNGKTIGMKDSANEILTVGNLISNGNLTLNVNAQTDTSDSINITDGSNTNAVLTISALNFTKPNVVGDSGSYTKQILTGNTTGASIVLSDSLATPTITALNISGTDEMTNAIKWNDIYGGWTQSGTQTETLEIVSSSDTLQDSIKYSLNKVWADKIYVAKVDNLSGINKYTGDGSDNRSIDFAGIIDDETAQGTYKVSENIGETAAGNLTINGEVDGNTRSILDFDNHSGFELNNNDTTLVLKDVELTGANTLVSGNATDNVKIVLDNVVLDGTNGGITTYGDVEIKGNSTISDNITILGGADSNVDIDGTDEITLDSTMIGVGSKLNIHDGTVNLTNNAQISAFDLTLTDTSLNIANENSLAGLNTTFDGTNNLNIANDSVGVLALGNVNLNGLLKMQVDADLANKQMDQLTATSATVNGGSIEVSKINLLSATTDEKTSLLFTNNSDLANAVSYTGEGTIVYSPIYKYETSYNVKDGQGYFDFVLPSQGGDTPGPVPSDFNPAVLASSVASQAGAMGAMNQSMYYAFEHGDTFMNSPSADRFAQINANSYALSTDYNENREHIDFAHNNKGVWVKPYTVFENIPLKNGPKINAISYGTLIGFDSDFHKMKKGWTNTATAYVGYNGSQLDYTGVDTSTNGGLLGLTETFYKGNFWTAITATAGASVAESHTMYGHDNMTSLMAGIGSKTGYNFEFNEGKFIIQPRLFLSYSFIKTFDYTNAAGVRIDSDPLHTIQINPALKFIGNVKGWQPYASVGMVWNVMDQTKATANGVKLPEMHIKPYVEYGVGVQKHWNEKYSAYIQAMVRNGGRNGIALTGGFRWALGRDSKPVEKVQRVNNKQAKATPSTLKVKSDKKILNQVKNDKKQVQNAKPQTKSALRIKIDTFFAKMNGEPLL